MRYPKSSCLELDLQLAQLKIKFRRHKDLSLQLSHTPLYPQPAVTHNSGGTEDEQQLSPAEPPDSTLTSRNEETIGKLGTSFLGSSDNGPRAGSAPARPQPAGRRRSAGSPAAPGPEPAPGRTPPPAPSALPPTPRPTPEPPPLATAPVKEPRRTPRSCGGRGGGRAGPRRRPRLTQRHSPEGPAAAPRILRQRSPLPVAARPRGTAGARAASEGGLRSGGLRGQRAAAEGRAARGRPGGAGPGSPGAAAADVCYCRQPLPAPAHAGRGRPGGGIAGRKRLWRLVAESVKAVSRVVGGLGVFEAHPDRALSIAG
ncbi:translation initiation factor IF-2-like isoform X1 [Gallus gallus]|uniref:translation initiation factor IF-2-like isoform X1 n=1 Tax=Gallus gallus TaxID=9031 RepID=UPI000739E4E5|nr:translation initiation factor IF-2-like isoform X1 [Gallus gallus]|eukprot:XP_015138146.1 uncharacterized protein LOC107052717 [Gallus gallus]